MENFNFTKPGRAWNEDRCYSCEKFIFVLDGATAISKDKFSSFNSDAEWVSDWWYKYLIRALKDESKGLLELLKEGLTLCHNDFEKLSNGAILDDYPSTTLSIVRRRNGKLEIFAVADSPIILQANTGLAVEIFDNRCDMLDDINKIIVKDFAEKYNIPVMQARQRFGDCIKTGRTTKNKQHGYYVIDTTGNFEIIDNAIYKEVDENLIKKVIIMSDGFSQIFDLFNYYSLEELANNLNSAQDAEKIYDILCDLQNKDIDGNVYVRFKIRDDASVAVLKFW